jgi:hypothetical protein
MDSVARAAGPRPGGRGDRPCDAEPPPRRCLRSSGQRRRLPERFHRDRGMRIERERTASTRRAGPAGSTRRAGFEPCASPDNPRPAARARRTCVGRGCTPDAAPSIVPPPPILFPSRTAAGGGGEGGAGCCFMDLAGFEPATSSESVTLADRPRLLAGARQVDGEGQCSTTELQARCSLHRGRRRGCCDLDRRCARRESNPRPLDYQSITLVPGGPLNADEWRGR